MWNKTCVTSNSKCTISVCCIVVVNTIYFSPAYMTNVLTTSTIRFEISGIQAFSNDDFNSDHKIPQLRVYQSKRPINTFLSNSVEFLIKLFDKK